MPLFDHRWTYAHDTTGNRGWLDAEGWSQPQRILPWWPRSRKAQMLAMEPRVKSNILAEVQSFSTLYIDPIIAAEHHDASDLDLSTLRCRPTSVSISVVQPPHKRRLRPCSLGSYLHKFFSLSYRISSKWMGRAFSSCSRRSAELGAARTSSRLL